VGRRIAGLQLEKELRYLNSLTSSAARPLVAIVSSDAGFVVVHCGPVVARVSNRLCVFSLGILNFGRLSSFLRPLAAPTFPEASTGSTAIWGGWSGRRVALSFLCRQVCSRTQLPLNCTSKLRVKGLEEIDCVYPCKIGWSCSHSSCKDRPLCSNSIRNLKRGMA
jgi:hypothetical protein